jgi:hypothetical protein
VTHAAKKRSGFFRTSAKLAQGLWTDLSSSAMKHLKELTEQHGLSIAAGDLQFLQGRWYVTHAHMLGCSESPNGADAQESGHRWNVNCVVPT